MKDSIFTQIINGEIPCHKVYEDDRVLAFLDIFPAVPGHTLVVPKRQVEFVWDLEEEDYQALMNAARLVARRLREVMPQQFVGEKIVGIDVPHAHVHLLPFDKAAELNLPNSTDEPDHEALANLAEKLRF